MMIEHNCGGAIVRGGQNAFSKKRLTVSGSFLVFSARAREDSGIDSKSLRSVRAVS
jgi:hypothetical protein